MDINDKVLNDRKYTVIDTFKLIIDKFIFTKDFHCTVFKKY